MFPVFWMRIYVAAGLLLGGLWWWLAAGWLLPVDGAGGLSILAGGEGVGPALRGLVIMLLAGVPAVAVGLVVGAMGSPLSGLFVVCGSLMFAAIRGGPMIGLFQRWEPAGSLGLFGLLMAELALWAMLLGGVMWLLRRTRRPLRLRLRRWAVREHLGGELELGWPWRPGAWVAGLLCAGVGGFGLYVLVQVPGTGQVVGSLLLVFLLAGTFAHLLVAQWNASLILLGPLLSGAAGYGWAIWHFESYAGFLEAAYSGDVSGLALVPPVAYASAGVAGSVLGVGLGQAIEHSRPVQASAEGVN